MRSIVRRDNSQQYEAFVGWPRRVGISTPTRKMLAQLDRKRKKKGSNKRMEERDRRRCVYREDERRLARIWPTKAEHAVDMESGAVIAVTLQGADPGRHHHNARNAGRSPAGSGGVDQAKPRMNQKRSRKFHVNGITGMVADKGYHSGKTLVALPQAEARSYIPEPNPRTGVVRAGKWESSRPPICQSAASHRASWQSNSLKAAAR